MSCNYTGKSGTRNASLNMENLVKDHEHVLRRVEPVLKNDEIDCGPSDEASYQINDRDHMGFNRNDASCDD